MTPELYEALEALALMWDQYCPPPWTHKCMTAGEHAEDVLDMYGLLDPETRTVNEAALAALAPPPYPTPTT